MEKLTYKNSGVDKEAGYESVELIKKHVKETFSKYVLTGLGSFGGAVELPEGYKKPVLISGTDGVGTKLILAHKQDIHDTVGIDLVAMCVNDILCHGARPLFFLDYIACGKNYPKKIESIVKGVSEGCKQGMCALVGGETAEMPGMYKEDDYDLAGFCVGVVDKDKFISGKDIKEGDKIIGLPSSGVHSNGYSLLRKLFFEVKDYDVDTYVESLGDTIGKTLLTPTKIYVKSILSLLEKVDIKGMCHITGGGFVENIPRVIPDGLCAKVDTNKVNVLPIFDLISKEGNIDKKEMFSTFNMGIGFVVVVRDEDCDKTLEELKALGEDAVVLGEVIKGEEKIELCL
ncbi:phosphoribosylformylglycinamidine cyclo-ligase [Anaerofustis stercorihominis]|uniref:phosphoribosylformylglycinamidine cyclo-ligase n=1 Tax=Anaerofustis TaxID=264995 RepID=UPI0011066717|nr:phosphoribosylformylglycinamidine cyclo-ligase [Anaerofustis stercorihominis]MCO8194128.1 phosphoribosylformylglycinamidine cyclo-ligase [Anaerofustis sp. NSJ-163]